MRVLQVNGWKSRGTKKVEKERRKEERRKEDKKETVAEVMSQRLVSKLGAKNCTICKMSNLFNLFQ